VVEAACRAGQNVHDFLERPLTETFLGSVVSGRGQAEARATANDFSRGTSSETLLNRNKEREKLEATSIRKPALGVGVSSDPGRER